MVLKLVIFAVLCVFNVDSYVLPPFSRNPCPGQPIVMCSYPPCSLVMNDNCKETFCGTCKANCYDSRDNPIECTYISDQQYSSSGQGSYSLQTEEGNPFQGNPCPDDTPMVMCSYPPPCSLVTNRNCKETFCGTCKANCYDSRDNPIECTYISGGSDVTDQDIGHSGELQNLMEGNQFQGNPCPDDTPMVMCSYPPCALVTNRNCKDTFCGTCKANCYDSRDNPIECTYLVDQLHSSSGQGSYSLQTEEGNPFQGNPCPDNTPMVMCSYPPCALVTNRNCKETFCGTCKANCYDSRNNPIECTYIVDQQYSSSGQGSYSLQNLMEGNEFQGNPCPDNTPMVMCSHPPCSLVTNRNCKETFCGTCKANCYDSRDNPIECNYIDNETSYDRTGGQHTNMGELQDLPEGYPFPGNPCPDNTPMVMCSYPPCSVVMNQNCKETFCGTCKANCYDSRDNPIECTYFSGDGDVSDNNIKGRSSNQGELLNLLKGNPCPDNTPMVMCSHPPCSDVINDNCKETFCGTCKAHCYDSNDNPVNCTYLADKR